MNPHISDPDEAPPATNAVSLFNQGGGVNDFPVLKAFQEYIDAEQAKARKRMFGLSIFFIVLLVVVVVTFTIVMTSVIGRNQALSDRLLDIALREKNPTQPVVNVQQPIPSPVAQPVLQATHENSELVRLREELQREKDARQADLAKRDKEKIESLTAALAKAQQQPVAPTPVVVTTAPAPVVQPGADSAEVIRLREENTRLKAQQDKHEKEKQEAEEKAKKEAEKEKFLRRQYPDYYAKEDARKAAAAAEAARRAESPLPGLAPDIANQPLDAPPIGQPAPTSAELDRQRAEIDREEVETRRKEEEMRKAEQAKREEEKRKAEQAKPLPAPKASPSRPIPPSRPLPKTPPAKTVKPITYFDESKPIEDPELNELLGRNQAARTPPKTTAKPTQQPATKSAPQPTAKPAPKTPARPVATQQPAQKTEQSTHKTETLAIGGAAGGSSIPWLIELPVQQQQ